MATTTDSPDTPQAAADATPAPPVSLTVSDDQVLVLLDAVDPLADPAVCAAAIHNACEELKLPEIPDVGALSAFLQQVARPGEDLVREPLLRGRLPEPATDGRIEWAREFFRKGWAVDEESGAMDFWEPLERRSVEAGEEICRLLPPVPGRAGITVFDQPIPVRKPRSAKVRAGKNVEMVEQPGGVRVFSATCDGRLRHNAGVVSVDDVYVIKGDVSLETGNIYHTGTVHIQGDVKAGALVDVGGDVIVQGLVEPSTVQAGGSVTVHGGIVGDGTGSVEAVGDVQALYVSEASVTCGGNLIVRNEVSHAQVRCRGRVLVPAGRIAGGHVQALGCIRVAKAGASGATGTVLVAGLDPTLEERLEKLRGQLPRLEQAHKVLQETLQRFRLDGPEAGAGLDDERRQAVDELHRKLEQIEAAIEQVAQDVEQARAEAAAAAEPEILVSKELWSGTRLQLGEASLTVRTSVHKPRRVRRSGGKVMVLPTSEEKTVE